MRLIEAAETLFIRKGFEDASVEEISEMAGYSRGAFYSNFDDKEQVLLAVIDRRRPNIIKAVDEILQQTSEPAERVAAVREWFSNQWRLNDFIALRMEFSRMAMRDRAVRKHLAELRRKELETYALWVGQYLSATGKVAAVPAETIALVLRAVIQGLGTLAIDLDQESEQIYRDAARLVFDRMTASQNSQIGTLQC